MKKFGILLLLIISGCSSIPKFPLVNFCSQVEDVMKCADYDMNSVGFVSNWVKMTPQQKQTITQYSMIISQKEFLIKLRPYLIKLRKYKKQNNKSATTIDPKFFRVNTTYSL